LTSVIFSADDLQIVLGPPALGRRFLDVLLSQVDRAYHASFQRYHQVLVQRNHLLRRIAEGTAGVDELPFWDRQLAAEGAFLVQQRRAALDFLGPEAARLHAGLSRSGEALQVLYRSSLPEGADRGAGSFQQALEALRPREVPAGQSLAGPHRDDLALLVEGLDAAVYGSRGQARTVALALRLAEARFLARERGEEPVLLLDDLLSELDPQRQGQVVEEAARAEQALVTVAAWEPYRPLFGDRPRFLVSQGTVALES
jgi:DNA replication and repair protein RecF